MYLLTVNKMCTKILKQLIIFLILVLIKSVNSDPVCNCKPIKECPTFLNYFKSLEKPLQPTTVEFLRSKQCKSQNENEFPMICCLDTYSNPVVLRAKPHPKKSCRSQSECVILKNCAPFMSFMADIEKPLKPNVVDFLRKQECGFQEGFPKVCCTLIPKHLRILRHSNRPRARSPFNVLSIQMDSEEEKEVEDEFRQMVTENIKTPTHQIRPQEEILEKKVEAFNRAFELMGLYDNFDLTIRKKRSGLDNFPDVEIR